MTAIGSFGTLVPGVLGFVSLVLLVVATYVLVETWMLGLGRVRVYSAGAFAASLLLMWAIDFACYQVTNPSMLVGPPTYVLSVLPVGLYVVLLVVLIIVIARLAMLLRNERMARITPDSVKEAIDALPDGVSFSSVDGSPVLVNIRMDALAHDAFGTSLKNERTLWGRLCCGACNQDYAVEDVDSEAGRALLVATDGRSWQFSRRALAIDGVELTETIAADVTEEHALLMQLDERNRQMAEVNERLRAYGRDLVQLTREEEALAMKVRVHNEVGRAMVALRAYERQSPDQRDREQLLALWHRVTHLLEDVGQTEMIVDDWELLCKAAAAVDVRLTIEGKLPDGLAARKVAVMVVHECLNNAVRHGDAHEVNVTCVERDGMTELTVTNDGNMPAVPPEETGGLSNIRASVERVGGMLAVQWSPQVMVTARYGLED